MIRLTKDQVLAMHEDVIRQTGGSYGLRDEGLLESALDAPFQSFGGYDAYPTLLAKAARLGYGLVQDHAFIDGNKRIGAHVMLTFLALDGVELEYTQEELSSLFLDVSASRASFAHLARWIAQHLPIDRPDHHRSGGRFV